MSMHYKPATLAEHRTCANCGKSKDISGSKMCEKENHFICYDCVYDDHKLIVVVEKNKCPVCNSKLK